MSLEIDQACAGVDVLVADSHTTAKEKGWWEDGDRNIGELIALMHCELSEAMEEFRNDGNAGLSKIAMDVDGKPGKPGGVATEFADVLIRIFDFCGRYDVPLGEALRLKLAFNKTRPHRHGNKHA